MKALSVIAFVVTASLAVALESMALLLSFPAEAQTGLSQTRSLAGLWTAVLQEPQPLGGPVEISCELNSCRAILGRQKVVSNNEAGRVRFVFEGGTLTANLHNGHAVNAIWIQPPANVGGGGQGLASLVKLVSNGRHRYVGVVVPFVHESHIFLRIDPDSNGQLRAVFRNPEANQNGGAPQFQLANANDQLTFTGIDRKALLSGSVVDRGKRLSVRWPDVARPIQLHRASAAEAVRFYPRPTTAPAYAYAPPVQLRDGWSTATASSVGFDLDPLTRLVRSIAGQDPAERRTDLVHSILMARHGRLVFEEYFYGFDRNTPNDLRSASKTFASVLIGAERRRGMNLAPDTKVYQVLGSVDRFAHPDPRKEQITLENLLTHTSGLACDDNDDASPGNENIMQSQTQQPDWWRYTLDLPIVHEPGTRYAYCSANINLVGAVLHTATGSTIPELFEQDIAEPLQFGQWHWNLMPNGQGYLGGGAKLLSRDLLKVGQAFLNSGRWNDQVIVGAEWVSLSTQPRFQINPETAGLTPEAFKNSYAIGADALAWHETTATAGGRTYKGYAAGGNGGQLLLVFPELDLAVVITGGNYGQFGIWGRWTQSFVGDYIIPALRD